MWKFFFVYGKKEVSFDQINNRKEQKGEKILSEKNRLDISTGIIDCKPSTSLCLFYREKIYERFWLWNSF